MCLSDNSTERFLFCPGIIVIRDEVKEINFFCYHHSDCAILCILKYWREMMGKEREKQIRTEAQATFVVLLLVILFWIVAGFGVSYLHITVWHMPLWVLTGCIGTWIFAVLLVYLLITRIFYDMDLEDGAHDE